VHTFQILLVLAIAKAMAPPLAPPKGFKFRKFFSRADSHAASTSQVPPPIVVVPDMDDGSVQPATPVGEKKNHMRRVVNSRSFGCLFFLGQSLSTRMGRSPK
jgi:hypothetical protein